MTMVFIILAIVLIAAILVLTLKGSKEKEALHLYTPQNGSEKKEKATEKASVKSLKVCEVLFGKDGVLTKGETFFEGKVKNNSMLYMRAEVGLEGSAVFCGIADSEVNPKMQIAVQYGYVQSIGNPCNDQRQKIQPYIISGNKGLWLSTDVLGGMSLRESFVLRVLYRLDDGDGYGNWQLADTINILNK